MRVIGAALACCLAFPAPAHASEDAVSIAGIHARLFYKQTGRLSDDLLGRAEPFVGWNTIIGEGDAEEPADDLLVDVVIQADEEHFLDESLEVRVIDATGKVLGRRRFEGLLTSAQGDLHNPLWLSGVTCAGALTIEARFRDQRQSAKLDLDCGE